MAGSAGGLYLQVKLDTAAAERQLKSLGRAYTQAINPTGQANAAARAAAAQARETAAAQRAAAATARQTAAETTAAANVEVNRLKAEAAAARERGDAAKANARQRAAELAASNAATRAETVRAAEAAKTQRILTSDAVLRRRKQETLATQQQTRALRQAAKEAEALAKKGSGAQQIGRIAAAGSQDLFVGLGAARSGNIGYGLAAMTRYAQALTAAASGASIALVGVAAAVVAIGAVAITAGIAIGSLAKSLLEAGTQGAESFELLRIQLGGLLGSAKAGQDEFDFLIELGKTSIVPTEALIQADRTLVSFGVTAQSTRRELVTLFSNIGSAFSLTTDQIYFLSLAISQVVAKGKADAVDLRQLANNGISTTNLFESIAKQTGKSVKEVAAEQANGGLSAQQILIGLTGLTKEYQGAADAAAKSAGGLKSNLQDTFTAGLSNAFLKGGVLEPIKEFLQSILDTVGKTKGLFDPLAESARNLFSAVLGGGSAQAASGVITTLLTEIIPNAINIAANAINYLRPIVEQVFTAIGAYIQNTVDTFRALGPLFQALAPVFAGLVIGLQLAITGFAILGIVANTAMLVAVRGVQALYLALTGNFDQAFATIRNGLIDIAKAALQVQGLISGIGQFGSPSGGDNARRRSAERRKNRGSSSGGGSGADIPTGTDSSADTSAAKAAAQKIATARNELYDLLKTYFGQPSDALKGLFGDQGKFTATTDSIVNNAKRIYDAVLAAAPGARGRGIADFVEAQTEKLLKLAKRRDQVTKALEEANNRLKALIDERDAFIKQIKDSAQSFVFDLNVPQTTNTRDVTGPGSAGTSTTTGAGSFAESVKKRLADYRAFVANIRKLAKAGLDKSIIREFLQAGPGAAGEIVAQLANAGGSIIADLNLAQMQLKMISEEFGVEQGGVYYQAGIDSAQQTVDGLESQLDTITAAAKKITKAILKAIKPLAKEMKDVAASAGSGAASSLLNNLKTGLETSTTFDNPFKGMFDDSETEQLATDLVDTFLGQVDPNGVGKSIVEGIAEGIRNAAAQAFINIATWMDEHIVQPIKDFFGIASPAKTMIPIGEDIIGGMAKGLLSAILALPGTIVRAINENVVTPVRNAAVRVWNQLTSGLSGTKIVAALRTAFEAVVTWMGGLRDRIAAAAGNVWGFLTTKFPSLASLTKLLQPLKDAFRTVLKGVVDLWNRLDFSIHIKAPDWLGGYSFDVDDIFPDVTFPSAANGAIFTAPTLAKVGDNKSRPEAVVPLTSKGISTFMEGVGAGGDIAVEARVFIGDRELTDIVRTEVKVIDRSTAIAVAGNRRL